MEVSVRDQLVLLPWAWPQDTLWQNGWWRKPVQVGKDEMGKDQGPKIYNNDIPKQVKTSQKAPFLKVSTPPLAPGTGNSVLAHGLENFTQAIFALSKISWLWVHVFLCICLCLFLLPPSSLPVPCCLDYYSFVICFEKVVSHYTSDTDST